MLQLLPGVASWPAIERGIEREREKEAEMADFVARLLGLGTGEGKGGSDIAARQLSDKIDAQLKADQAKKLKTGIPVLVLGPNRHDSGRRQVMMMLEEMGEVKNSREDPKTGYAYVNLAIPDGNKYFDCNEFTISAESFPCDKKNKWSCMQLSASCPSVLVYVVNLANTSESASLGVTSKMTRRLRRALGHLLFVCHTVGSLRDVVVSLVLTNVDELQDRLENGVCDDAVEDFTSCFPLSTRGGSFAECASPKNTANSLSSDKNSISSSSVQAVIGEFETAVRSYNPQM